MITLFKTKSLLRINYKSGNHIEMWFKEFSIQRQGNEIAKAEWTHVNRFQQILHLNVDQVESVYQIDARLNLFTAIAQLFSRNR